MRKNGHYAISTRVRIQELATYLARELPIMASGPGILEIESPQATVEQKSPQSTIVLQSPLWRDDLYVYV